MLKFYFSGASNPTKVALFLEETGLPYDPIGAGRFAALTRERRPSLALPFHGRQGGVRPAALCGCLDGGVNLAEAAVEIGDPAGSNLDFHRQGRVVSTVGTTIGRFCIPPRASDYWIGFPRVITGVMLCARHIGRSGRS